MSDTTTAQAGAGQTADVKQVPSASQATTRQASPDAQPRSLQERMAASAERGMRQGRAEEAAPEVDGDDQRATSPNADAEESSTADDTAGKEKADVVPRARLNEALSKERKRTEDARGQLAAAQLENRKAMEAVRLLQSSVEELQKRMAEGVAYDPRDLEIMQHKMAEDGRSALEKITQEHAEMLRSQAEQMRQEQQHEQLRQSYGKEVDAALSSFPLVSRRDLIAEMKVEARKSRPASAEQLAKVLHEKALVIARQVTGSFTEESQVPSSARAPGARSPTRFPLNAKGFEDFINSRNAR